jgi:hypothetical protein
MLVAAASGHQYPDLSGQDFGSIRSKKCLNKPVYEASNTGVPIDDEIGGGELPVRVARNLGDVVVGHRAAEGGREAGDIDQREFAVGAHCDVMAAAFEHLLHQSAGTRRIREVPRDAGDPDHVFSDGDGRLRDASTAGRSILCSGSTKHAQTRILPCIRRLRVWCGGGCVELPAAIAAALRRAAAALRRPAVRVDGALLDDAELFQQGSQDVAPAG